MNLTEQTEKVVEILTADLLRQKEAIDLAWPKPPFAIDAPMEVRLQRLNQSWNPVTISAFRKLYGRKMLVQEFLKDNFLVNHLQRSAPNGTQGVDTTGAEGPAAAASPEG